MPNFLLNISAAVLLLSTLGAPGLLGANREWSVAMVTMGVAFAGILLALGRPDLFQLKQSRPLWKLRWLLLGAALIFLIAALPLALPRDSLWGGQLPSESVTSLPPDPTMVLQALLGYTATCLTLLLAYLIGTAKPRWRTPLVYLFLACCTGYSLYGIAADCVGAAQACNAVAAPFVNRNTAATYFGFGVVAAFLFLIRNMGTFALFDGAPTKHARRRTLDLLSTLFGRVGAFAAAFLITAAALLLTQSRAGTVSVGLALIFSAALIWWRMGLLRGLPRIASLAAIALVVTVWVFASGNLIQRFEETSISSDARWSLYQRSAEMIVDRPLTGHGFGTFQERLPLYRTPEMGPYPDFDKAHNSYLDLAVGIGVPGALIVFAMFAWILGVLIEQYLRPEKHRVTLLIGAAMIVQVAAHSLVDFSMQIPGIQASLSLILGLALAEASDKERQGRSWRQIDPRAA